MEKGFDDPPGASAPDRLQAWLEQGADFHRQGKLTEAKPLYEAILREEPGHFDALNLLGTLALQLGDNHTAVDLIGRAIAVNPHVAMAHNNRANALVSLRRLEEALASYDRALVLQPNDAGTLSNRSVILLELDRAAEALSSVDTALGLAPHSPEAHYNRGNALLKLGRLEEARASYEAALAFAPDAARVHNNHGLALVGLGRANDALASFDAAIVLQPDYADAHSNRGLALGLLDRLEDALASSARALAIDPNHAEAHYHGGDALLKLGRADEALARYDAALALQPGHAGAQNNRGNALFALLRFDDALAAYDRTLALNPGSADAHYNRGNALFGLRRMADALVSFDKALSLKPDHAEAAHNHGNTLLELGRLDEALTSLGRALALKPDYPFLHGTTINTKMRLCDWRNVPEEVEVLRRKVAAGIDVTSPFPLLALIDEPQVHRQAARMYADSKVHRIDRVRPTAQPRSGERIRIGYYSSDFRDHPVARLVAEVIELHDRSRFEVIGFFSGPPGQDAMRQRLSAAFDRSFDVSDQGDGAVAQLSRDLGIDIAIELNGHTHLGRLGTFAAGCAPVQVSYLGYPGTTAADCVDYIFADDVVIDGENRSSFSEQVISLPGSYQANDTKRKISDRAFTRSELGLPETGFVFCCFNNSFKILPEVFDRWIKLLAAVDGSVLWLLEDNARAAANLQREAEARGIDARRLVFAPRIPMDQHLARQKRADLFLDTFPYNAHTTASDALWVGLPVLTCKGKSFASRVAASLLHAVGLPELVTTSLDAYAQKALELALDRTKLDDLKRKLKTNRLHAPLFASRRYTRHLEAAYTRIHARAVAGMRPEGFRVE